MMQPLTIELLFEVMAHLITLLMVLPFVFILLAILSLFVERLTWKAKLIVEDIKEEYTDSDLPKHHPSGGEFLSCRECFGAMGDMIRIGTGKYYFTNGGFVTNVDGSPVMYYRWLCECGAVQMYDVVKPQSEAE